MTYLSVALGGAAGAMLRYGLSGWLHDLTGMTFPIGTLVVNILGSFIIGLVLELSAGRYLFSPEARLLITTGFCGALTTFSTFSFETLALVQEQQWGAAAGNVVLNLGVCLVATFAGVMLARAL
ncbi:MAG TPA: fluoride efflux transporter CrcB [bacterium]|nr:fluoride efflux transporter CrcB [bacterium]